MYVPSRFKVSNGPGSGKTAKFGSAADVGIGPYILREILPLPQTRRGGACPRPR
ncbi:hypothetical protein HMPREF0239_04678, partial [Clostridium sp. ATCC BAA-442]